ncbi:MAG: hypothetical protein AB8F74_15940 [Saprospiraceae bacterium]
MIEEKLEGANTPTKKKQKQRKPKGRKSYITAGVNTVVVSKDRDGDPSESPSDSSSSSDDSNATGRRRQRRKTRKGRSSETVMLQTLAQKAPEVPKIEKLDDEGFRSLHDAYKTYKEECKRHMIIPRTIDNCITDKLREKFRYGFLDQSPDDADEFTEADVYKYIDEAKERAPEDQKDLCLKTLGAVVKNSYDMKIDTVQARVNGLKADIKCHLHQSLCMVYWKIPKRGERDEHKYARGVIVQAIMKSLKPDDFRKSMELEIRNSNMRYDHLKVLSRIVVEGESWERVYRKKLAVAKAEDGYKETKAPEADVFSHVATTGKEVKRYLRADCIFCKAKDHWFLRRSKDGGYEQNCPKPCPEYARFKEVSLNDIDERMLKKKQRHDTTKALLVNTEKRFDDLTKQIETLSASLAQQSLVEPEHIMASQVATPGRLVQSNDERLMLLTKQM